MLRGRLDELIQAIKRVPATTIFGVGVRMVADGYGGWDDHHRETFHSTLATVVKLSGSEFRLPPGVPRIPKCHLELVLLAKRVAQHLRTPFISVDTYASNDGPVIGELTATPGAPYYGKMFRLLENFDSELGALWRDNSERLGIAIPLWNDDNPPEKRPSSMPKKSSRAESPPNGVE